MCIQQQLVKGKCFDGILIVIMLNKKEQKKLIDLMLENAKKGIKCFEYKVVFQESKIKEILDFLKTVLIKTKLEVDECELNGEKKPVFCDATISYAGMDEDKFMILQRAIDRYNIKPTYIYLTFCIDINFDNWVPKTIDLQECLNVYKIHKYKKK